MSPQANPSEEQQQQQLEVDTSIVAPKGEPPLVEHPIPLKDQVTLYFRQIGAVYGTQIQRLVEQKTNRQNGGRGGYGICTLAEQNRIVDEVKMLAGSQWPPWSAYREDNVGRYIASGLTRFSDLDLAVGLSEEEAKPFALNHRARSTNNKVYEAAMERLELNRRRFVGRARNEDNELQAARDGAKAAQGRSFTHAADDVAMHANAEGVEDSQVIIKEEEEV